MDQLASGNAVICGKYQYAYGLMGRLGVGIPPVLDTVSSGCSHNFILDRPVLSIVHDILAVYQTHDLTMVLTMAQMTTFFEHADQMGIPHTTVLKLQSEGITLVSDLADFNKDSLQQLADNLRHPGRCVLDPNPAAQPGSNHSNSTICISCQVPKTYLCCMRFGEVLYNSRS